MSEDEKSTGPNLSAAERKALRVQEAQEAIADHEEAQRAFQENRERLRNERLVREAAEGPMVAPTPELPDDTPIERVLFSTRIQNARRLAQRIPVGIHLTHVPPGVLISAGMTCTAVMKEGAAPEIGLGIRKAIAAIFGPTSS